MAFAPQALTTDAPPSILTVLSEDHSAVHLGCYGNPDIPITYTSAVSVQEPDFESFGLLIRCGCLACDS